MPALPRLLDGRHLPEAALRAAVLDGELIAVGTGFIPVDLPLDASLRARSLSPLVPPDCVLAGRTASWVWGATPDPGAPYAVLIPRSAPRGHALGFAEHGVRFASARLQPGDAATVGGVAVTSALRTAMDRLRGERDPPPPAELSALLEVAGCGPAELSAVLAARDRLPGRRRALARLQVLVTR